MNTDVVMFLTVTGMVSFIFWVVFSTFRRIKVARAQAELNAKLLERFASGHDLAEYMNSEAGKKFLESALNRLSKSFGLLGTATESRA